MRALVRIGVALVALSMAYSLGYSAGSAYERAETLSKVGLIGELEVCREKLAAAEGRW